MNLMIFLFISIISDVAVRMLDYRHMACVCLLACVIIWSLVFAWQHDASQAQCDSYLWLLYLPGSFIVNLVNMKAYRLSLFVRLDISANAKRAFNHSAVLVRAVGLTAFTIIILLGAALGDPFHPSVVIVDRYRPSLNYHTCRSQNGATTGIMSLIVAYHIVMSVICVARVRNGFEAFRDGMLMKEAYVLLYGSILIALVMHNLSLRPAEVYILRTALVSVGLTGFCARILLCRCLPHLIPSAVRKWETETVDALKKAFEHAFHVSAITPPTLAAASSVMYRSSLSDLENGHGHGDARDFGSINESIADLPVVKKPTLSDAADEGPMYKQEAPTESSIADMLRVIADPVRGKMFHLVAEKALTAENVDFLQAVLRYQTNAEEILLQSSVGANAEIKRLAAGIYEQYLKSGAEAEVNVSSAARSSFDRRMRAWREEYTMLSDEQCRHALSNDPHQRVDVFQQSMMEISVLLYQNIWNNFRAAETTAQMAAGRSMAAENRSSITGSAVMPAVDRDMP